MAAIGGPGPNTPISTLIDYTADNIEGMQVLHSLQEEPDYSKKVSLANFYDLHRRAHRIHETINRPDFSFGSAKLIASYGPSLSRRVLTAKVFDEPGLWNLQILNGNAFTFKNTDIILSAKGSLPSIAETKNTTAKKVVDELFAEASDPEPGSLLPNSEGLSLCWSPRSKTMRMITLSVLKTKSTGSCEHLLPAQMTEDVMWDSTETELSIRSHSFLPGNYLLLERTIVFMNLLSETHRAILVRVLPLPPDKLAAQSMTFVTYKSDAEKGVGVIEAHLGKDLRNPHLNRNSSDLVLRLGVPPTTHLTNPS